LCLAAEKPLLEAGSTGHLGQVTVIKKGETECFECQAKPTQKVYPYCTIRSTPEKPVHCLTWAKNLYDLCFGPEDESNLLTDLAAEMKEVTRQEKVDGEEVGKKIYAHLFDADIRKQAALEDLWSEKRPPPDPLPYSDAMQKSSSSAAPAKDGAAMLDVQKVPTVAADAVGFVNAVKAMYSEARRGMIGTATFSKDDSVSMDFVHCAANLRMSNYRIGRLSRWDAQSIAGAIIPAVASTNAIVAGLEVVQLIHVLEATKKPQKCCRESLCRTVWVRYPEPSRKKILQPSTLQKPNEDCFVCGSRMARIALKGLAEWKICDLVKKVVQGSFGAVSPALYHNSVCIYSPEYPEASEEAEEEGMHPEWSLTEWGLSAGSLLQVEDEAQGFSCNILLRDEPELSEEAFPNGFQVEAGGEKALAEDGDDKKRKADAAAEESAAKKAKNGQAANVVELGD
jgi:ubiquitin-like 1-activating enzyme E1 B